MIRIISTATLHANIEKWSTTQLHHPVKVAVYQLNSNIQQKLQYVGDEKGRIYELLNIIKSVLHTVIHANHTQIMVLILGSTTACACFC